MKHGPIALIDEFMPVAAWPAVSCLFVFFVLFALFFCKVSSESHATFMCLSVLLMSVMR